MKKPAKWGAWEYEDEYNDPRAEVVHDFTAYIESAAVGDDARSIISRHEGGLRSEPYRCVHMVVTVGGQACLICGLDLEGTTWQEAWNRTGPQAPSRPLPSEHGIGAVVIRTGEGERDE